jgi:hypothetical protein
VPGQQRRNSLVKTRNLRIDSGTTIGRSSVVLPTCRDQ